METTYDIVTRFFAEDKGAAAVQQMTAGTEGLRKTLFSGMLASNLFANVITRTVSAVANAIRGLTQDMVDLNQEFEDQRLSLAALVNANLKFPGATPAEGLQASTQIANDQLNEFVTAAKTAPGTARDFSNIAQMIIDPFLKAGGKMGAEMTDFVKKTLIAGQFTGQHQEVTARDAQQLLQGLAKSVDRLPKLLNISPEEINKLKPDERLKKINEALSRVVTPETQAMLEDSFTTVRATFSDMIDIIKRTAGAPAFDALKAGLKSLNAFLTENGAVISSFFGGTVQAVVLGIKILTRAMGVYLSPIMNLIRVFSSGSRAAVIMGAAIKANFEGMLDAIDRFFSLFWGNLSTTESNFIRLASVFNEVFAIMGALADVATLLAVALSAPFRMIANLVDALANFNAAGGKFGLNPIENLKNLYSIGQETMRLNDAGVNKDIKSAFEQAVNPKLPQGPLADGQRSRFGLGNAAVSKIEQNFNGDININQNFKENADPDRIAFKVKDVLDKLKSRPTTSPRRFSLEPA